MLGDVSSNVIMQLTLRQALPLWETTCTSAFPYTAYPIQSLVLWEAVQPLLALLPASQQLAAVTYESLAEPAVAAEPAAVLAVLSRLNAVRAALAPQLLLMHEQVNAEGHWRSSCLSLLSLTWLLMSVLLAVVQQLAPDQRTPPPLLS